MSTEKWWVYRPVLFFKVKYEYTESSTDLSTTVSSSAAADSAVGLLQSFVSSDLIFFYLFMHTHTHTRSLSLSISLLNQSIIFLFIHEQTQFSLSHIQSIINQYNIYLSISEQTIYIKSLLLSVHKHLTPCLYRGFLEEERILAAGQ